MGGHILLQGIFPTQGSNPGLLHCRRILYHLSHQGRPRTLEWVAYPFSRGSSQPGIEPRSPTLQVDSLPAEPQGKPKNTGVGSLSFLQGNFPTQEGIEPGSPTLQVDSLLAFFTQEALIFLYLIPNLFPFFWKLLKM